MFVDARRICVGVVGLAVTVVKDPAASGAPNAVALGTTFVAGRS